MAKTVLNIFDGDAFSTVELTENVVEKVDFKPDLLGSMNLFEPIYSRSRTVAIVKTEKGMTMIPTSELGAPPEELVPEGADVRPFKTTRLAKGSTIHAYELEGILGLPFDEQVKEAQREVADRSARIRNDMELTHEHMRLGAVLGKVMDADGTTVLWDWFSTWGIAEPTEIDFDLDNANPKPGALRKKIRDLKRSMQVASKGAWTPRSRIVALCGDAFFDNLVDHPDYVNLRINNDRTRELEDIEGFSAIVFEGVTWINYRGTDDGSTLAIGTDKVRFFPRNTRGVFQVGYAPAEFFPYVNQRGREVYEMMLKDLQRDAWRRVEQYSYPLYICTRPEMLLTGKRT